MRIRWFCQEQLEPIRHQRLSWPIQQWKGSKKLHTPSWTDMRKCLKMLTIKCKDKGLLFPWKTVPAHSFLREKHFLGMWWSKDTVYKIMCVETRPPQGPVIQLSQTPGTGGRSRSKDKLRKKRGGNVFLRSQHAKSFFTLGPRLSYIWLVGGSLIQARKKEEEGESRYSRTGVGKLWLKRLHLAPNLLLYGPPVKDDFCTF